MCRRCASGAARRPCSRYNMLRKYSGAHGRPKRGFTEDAIAALEAYRLARQRA